MLICYSPSKELPSSQKTAIFLALQPYTCRPIHATKTKKKTHLFIVLHLLLLRTTSKAWHSSRQRLEADMILATSKALVMLCDSWQLAQLEHSLSSLSKVIATWELAWRSAALKGAFTSKETLKNLFISTS